MGTSPDHAPTHHLLQTSLQSIRSGHPLKAVYAACSAWTAARSACSEEEERLILSALCDALAYQAHCTIKGNQGKPPELPYTKADPQLLPDIVLVLEAVFEGGQPGDTAAQEGSCKTEQTDPPPQLSTHASQSPESLDSRAIQNSERPSGSSVPWPPPDLMSCRWQALASDVLERAMHLACHAELQRLHQGAAAMISSICQCAPAHHQQQQQQQQQQQPIPGHSGLVGHGGQAAADLSNVWAVMGRPSVVVLMSLLRWHTTDVGQRSALQALDVTRCGQALGLCVAQQQAIFTAHQQAIRSTHTANTQAEEELCSRDAADADAAGDAGKQGDDEAVKRLKGHLEQNESKRKAQVEKHFRELGVSWDSMVTGVDEGPQAVAWFLEEQLKERQVLPWTAWVLMHERRVDALVRCYGGEGGKLLVVDRWGSGHATLLDDAIVQSNTLRGKTSCRVMLLLLGPSFEQRLAGDLELQHNLPGKPGKRHGLSDSERVEGRGGRMGVQKQQLQQPLQQQQQQQDGQWRQRLATLAGRRGPHVLQATAAVRTPYRCSRFLSKLSLLNTLKSRGKQELVLVGLARAHMLSTTNPAPYDSPVPVQTCADVLLCGGGLPHLHVDPGSQVPPVLPFLDPAAQHQGQQQPPEKEQEAGGVVALFASGEGACLGVEGLDITDWRDAVDGAAGVHSPARVAVAATMLRNHCHRTQATAAASDPLAAGQQEHTYNDNHCQQQELGGCSAGAGDGSAHPGSDNEGAAAHPLPGDRQGVDFLPALAVMLRRLDAHSRSRNGEAKALCPGAVLLSYGCSEAWLHNCRITSHGQRALVADKRSKLVVSKVAIEQPFTGVYLQQGSELNAQALVVCDASSHGVEMYARCSAHLRYTIIKQCMGSAVFAYESDVVAAAHCVFEECRGLCIEEQQYRQALADGCSTPTLHGAGRIAASRLLSPFLPPTTTRAGTPSPKACHAQPHAHTVGGVATEGGEGGVHVEEGEGGMDDGGGDARKSEGLQKKGVGKGKQAGKKRGVSVQQQQQQQLQQPQQQQVDPPQNAYAPKAVRLPNLFSNMHCYSRQVLNGSNSIIPDWLEGNPGQKAAKKAYALQFPEGTSAAALLLDKTRAVVISNSDVKFCPVGLLLSRNRAGPEATSSTPFLLSMVKFEACTHASVMVYKVPYAVIDTALYKSANDLSCFLRCCLATDRVELRGCSTPRASPSASKSERGGEMSLETRGVLPSLFEGDDSDSSSCSSSSSSSSSASASSSKRSFRSSRRSGSNRSSNLIKVVNVWRVDNLQRLGDLCCPSPYNVQIRTSDGRLSPSWLLPNIFPVLEFRPPLVHDVVRQAKRQWFVHLQRSKKGSEGMLLLGRARHMAWQAACQPKLEFGYVNFSTHEVLGPVQQPCTRVIGDFGGAKKIRTSGKTIFADTCPHCRFGITNLVDRRTGKMAESQKATGIENGRQAIMEPYLPEHSPEQCILSRRAMASVLLPIKWLFQVAGAYVQGLAELGRGQQLTLTLSLPELQKDSAVLERKFAADMKSLGEQLEKGLAELETEPDKRFAAKARAALRRGSKKERALCRKDRDAAIHRNELRSYHIGTLGTGHEFSTAGDVVMHSMAEMDSDEESGQDMVDNTIYQIQVAHGLTMMSGELAFVRRFDAQQQSREENQSSAKHKGSTTTTTAAATAGSSNSSKGASGKIGAKDREAKLAAGEKGGIEDQEQGKRGGGWEGEEVGEVEDAAQITEHQERHDRIIRKWRQAAEAIEDLMEQWEGLRGLSQSSIQEVQKGTSSQRAQLDAMLKHMSARHARTLAHRSLSSAASSAVLQEGLSMGPALSGLAPAAQEGVWSSDSSSDSEELFAGPREDGKGRPGECLSQQPGCLVDRRSADEQALWNKVLERRKELRRINGCLEAIEAEQEALRKRPGKDGKVAAIKGLNNEVVDMVKKREHLALEAVTEIRALHFRRHLRCTLAQRSRLLSHEFGIRDLARDLNDYSHLKRFLRGSDELQDLDALGADLRRRQLKLDNAFEAERAEQQQEQQQQHYERVMTKKVLEGLEDEMMPASSSTSELFGEVDPREACVAASTFTLFSSGNGVQDDTKEASISGEVNSVCVSKPRRPQVPLADSDSESSFTMDMGGQQLSSTALMRAERAAQEERGAARSPAKSYLTGDAEQDLFLSKYERLLDDIRSSKSDDENKLGCMD